MNCWIEGCFGLQLPLLGREQRMCRGQTENTVAIHLWKVDYLVLFERSSLAQPFRMCFLKIGFSTRSTAEGIHTE